MSSLKYWIWLASIDGIGPVTALRLLEHFGTPENVYAANAHDYRAVDGVGPADTRRLTDKNTDCASKILADCERTGCRIITYNDALYPDRLRNIYDPPFVLYYRGTMPLFDDEPVVAIVGTRSSTPYGTSAAEKTAYRLAKHGFIVSTGLARGIDSAAAWGALRGGGRVAGVIGSGTDIVYPAENRGLFEEVAGSGAIISQYPPGTPAHPTHFPARNRIISGLSLGVAVIEAPKRSGALITAARALEQGRDVFALPGNVDARNNEGSNALMREGAIPMLSADDIISEYAALFPDKIIFSDDDDSPAAEYEVRRTVKKGIDNQSGVDYIGVEKIPDGLDGDELIVAKAVAGAALLTDDIIAVTGLPAQRVSPALTMLEINGHASRNANGKWKLEN